MGNWEPGAKLGARSVRGDGGRVRLFTSGSPPVADLRECPAGEPEWAAFVFMKLIERVITFRDWTAFRKTPRPTLADNFGVEDSFGVPRVIDFKVGELRPPEPRSGNVAPAPVEPVVSGSACRFVAGGCGLPMFG